MREVDFLKDSAEAANQRRRRYRRRKRKRRLGISPPVMFYITALLAAASAALVFLRGLRFIAFSIGAVLLILLVLIVNERGALARSERIRRPYLTRDKFNKLEVAVLFALLMACIYISVVAVVE